MVFQSYALYPHLSVRENIAFPLKAQKVPKEQHKQKVEWAAGLLGIEKLLDRKPRQLSGGERQRVALARAIVREPRVFLLDEPLSNLDAKLRTSAREELDEFHQRIKTTTIYVTHDQVEAMALGDRIVVLHQGEVRQIGTPQEVYDDPADTFVATFLGSPPMNLLETDDVIVGFRPERFLPAGLIAPWAPMDEVTKTLKPENLLPVGFAEFWKPNSFAAAMWSILNISVPSACFMENFRKHDSAISLYVHAFLPAFLRLTRRTPPTTLRCLSTN